MHFFLFQTIFFLTENFGELKNQENMSYFILLKIKKKKYLKYLKTPRRIRCLQSKFT